MQVGIVIELADCKYIYHMRNLILLLALPLLFSSCKNLIPYTDSLKQQYNWTNDEIKRLQFYVSHDIVLHHELKEGSTDIVNGKIKTVNGKKVDEIIIRSGTPGVLIEIPKQNKMLVSFEIDDNHNLSFGVNPNNGNKYVLLASGWDRGVGNVHYAGQEYLAAADSKYAFLLVDKRKLHKEEVKQRVASGRKVK